MKPHLHRLRSLLGSQVLLIPVRKGTKRPTIKWGRLTIADMSDPKYLAKLNRAANIGVVLGKVSGGLCSIDIDEDGMVEPMLKLNPMLAATLRRKTRR